MQRHRPGRELVEIRTAEDPAGERVTAARPASAPSGSPRREAASTRLPNRRPRSTPGSAIRQACGNTARTVATRARACASGGPSPMLAAKIPAGASAAAAAAANSTVVTWAGVRPPVNRSAMTRSNAALTWARTARASPTRMRTRVRAVPCSGPADRAAAPPDQVHQGAVGVNGQLAGSGTGRRHIPGQGEPSAAQMQDPQRLPVGRGEVSQVPEPPHVLELQVQRVVEVHMGLRDAVHLQRPGPRPARVGHELGHTRIDVCPDGRPAPAVLPVGHNPSIPPVPPKPPWLPARDGPARGGPARGGPARGGPIAAARRGPSGDPARPIRQPGPPPPTKAWVVGRPYRGQGAVPHLLAGCCSSRAGRL